MHDIKSYAFFKTLTELLYIDRIILYGSRARNDFGERSDIDLAIECSQATAIEWNAIIDIIENADTLLFIDCVRFDTLSKASPLRRSIIDDGIVLYQRDTL